MASLKEIKGRINSVKSTLKITSAMKLVASSKLRKAQSAIENMLPYETELQSTLSELLKSVRVDSSYTDVRDPKNVALVCFASNSSLCGGFNANVIREARARISELERGGANVTVYSIGRKMADAMKSDGHISPADFTSLAAKPEYSRCAEISRALVGLFLEGKCDRVELVYNHFVSTVSQKVTREVFLPMAENQTIAVSDDEYIVEPDKVELVESLLPKTLNLKIYTTLLDSVASEHAARTVAMQTATDNAEDLLQQLSLEYNKGRQQKITSEILDLVGGLQQS